jgi:hypothetical protein
MTMNLKRIHRFAPAALAAVIIAAIAVSFTTAAFNDSEYAEIADDSYGSPHFNLQICDPTATQTTCTAETDWHDTSLSADSSDPGTTPDPDNTPADIEYPLVIGQDTVLYPEQPDSAIEFRALIRDQDTSAPDDLPAALHVFVEESTDPLIQALNYQICTKTVTALDPDATCAATAYTYAELIEGIAVGELSVGEILQADIRLTLGEYTYTGTAVYPVLKFSAISSTPTVTISESS